MALQLETDKTRTSLSEAKVLEKYLPLVRRRANAFRHKGVEPDDLMQEGLLGLLYAARAYRPDGGAGFETFAYTCVTNRLRSAVERASSAEWEHAPEGAPVEFFSEKQDPQEILLNREEVRRWLAAIAQRLSGLERDVIRMYGSGYTYREMANILHLTTKGVDNALQRARRKLRAV